ncbi:MAG: SIR2 family protein [Mesorhizobium sp.]|nr:MAG: SIR2 family protein [Mesorhizobium sp.]
MAAPSNLPSAKRVAEMCFDAYRLTADQNCDIALRGNLEALAEHFSELGILKSVFIEELVPWNSFARPSNVGHAAIADLLITGAAAAALSSNYDILIERRAWDYGSDFRGSLDGDEANVDSAKRSALLKFHGCSHRDKVSTIWAPSQFQDPVIAGRIARSKTWMAANLREKDLLVVGFWSDWDYLNQLLGAVLRDVAPLSVTVVDPSKTNQLQQKAPDLWALAHSQNVIFNHVLESGADVLDDLRRTFSKNYVRQFLAAGRPAFEAEVGIECAVVLLESPDFDSETLYDWRRDAEGVPSGEPAVMTHPTHAEALGFFHLLLRHAGADLVPTGYHIHGRIIRVINGAGAILGTLRTKFVEAPAALGADIVVAVGATDLGLPGNVVRRGRVGDVVRPEAGGEWFDMQSARAELNI